MGQVAEYNLFIPTGVYKDTYVFSYSESGLDYLKRLGKGCLES